MSRQLELIKQMSERGCIEDPETIDLVIKKPLAIPITELGTNTGSNFTNIREFLIEDGNRELNEDIGGELNISDLIGISKRRQKILRSGGKIQPRNFRQYYHRRVLENRKEQNVLFLAARNKHRQLHRKCDKRLRSNNAAVQRNRNGLLPRVRQTAF